MKGIIIPIPPKFPNPPIEVTESTKINSTPDLSHIDQLTVIVSYVSPDDGLPVERFLTFLEMGSHPEESTSKVVHNYLTNECKIHFRKSRGHRYDNAANISAKFKVCKINRFMNLFDHFDEEAKEKLPDVDYKKSRIKHIYNDEVDALEKLEPKKRVHCQNIYTCDGCIRTKFGTENLSIQ
ncbi:zinc finger MYM-type protein 1 [Caerostris darwini]|uniref:Zinc finger MYM-type protein 1 n=1 Tax=Caerostris darwini TaxID=1538125 RepID=A0AAV4T0B7_9ARAC|nr:zinc finger MYM-type protein 1 [Caerostris darwini]